LEPLKGEVKSPNFLNLIRIGKILRELNGKSFKELSEEQQDTIFDRSLTLIEISERDNPHFNPISLFIRLNSKPYPIDENSFEMWNSYLDRELTDLIKVDSEKSYFRSVVKWAYLKKRGKRMENEEIYTILAHIDYNVSYGGLKLLDILDIHLKNGRTVIRLKRYNKRYTTRFLENRVNIDERVRGRFIESLKNIRGVFEKIGMLLSIIDDNVDIYIGHLID